MTRFIDEYSPSAMPGYPCHSSPRWSTGIVQVDSGAEQVNQRWVHPLHRFVLPNAVRNHAVFEGVKDHWMAMRGPAYTWPFRDPLDFASKALSAANSAPTVTRTDQSIGTGDGVTTTFQLTKAYTRGPQTYSRNIHLPRTSSVLVGIDGADPTTLSPAITWSVSRPGGVITFNTAPANGTAITAGFLFDVEVRFADDNAFDGIVQSFEVSGFADIELVEVRYCP